MADNGISNVSSGATSGLSQLRRSNQKADQTQGQAQRASSRAQSDVDQRSRQTINIDGKTFDATAPRGTYLNILA